MSNSWDALTPYRYFPRWIAYTEIEACETTLPKLVLKRDRLPAINGDVLTNCVGALDDPSITQRS